MLKQDIKKIIAIVVVAIVGVITGIGFSVTISKDDDGFDVSIKTEATIEYAEEQKDAVVETTGETEVVDVPTVEAVDGGELTDVCGEDEECGQGWWVDTSSPETFKNAIIGTCVDTDGHYGSQCWDAANLFWQNYAGRTFSTCGTGAAKGTLGCYETNAGEEFEMVWDATQLQPGDWVVFTNGQYGHVGMAMGEYNNGYITLLGTNQGGSSCSGGGSSANIINISLKYFGGAFRPKSYIKPVVAEEIPISGCVEWAVERGDTMSKIMLECEGTVVYGDAMNAYADSWISRYVKPGQSVYEGWKSETGVGLYAGDTIDHETK